MKKATALLLAALLCLCLAACSKAPEQSSHETHMEAADTESTEEMRQEGSSSVNSGSAAEKSEEPSQQSVKLAGPWHLDSEKN